MELAIDIAADGDSCHTGDAVELAGQRVADEVGKHRNVLAVIGHGGHLHRQHGGIDLEDKRSADGISPTALQGAELLLDVNADGIHIDAVFKFQHDHGHTVLRGGGDGLDLIQRGHGLLHRSGHIRLYRLGTGAGIGGHDNDIGEIHIGHQIGRHLQIRHHAQHQHSQHGHKDGQRLFNAEFRHTLLAPLLKTRCYLITIYSILA